MNGNPFYVEPADYSQGLQGLGRGVQRMRAGNAAEAEKTAQQAKLDAQKGIMGSYFDAVNSNDIAAQQQIIRNNPMMSGQLQQLTSLGNKQQDAMKNEMASRVKNEGWTGQMLLQTFGPAAKAMGMDIERIADLDQEQLEDVAEQSWMGSEQHKRWLEGQKAESEKGGSKIGTVSPKDFTVDSLKAYEESGDVGDLDRYRPKTVKIGNIEHIYNNETQKFEPVVDYGEEGLSGQEAASAENEAARNSRIEFGKQKDVWANNQPKYLNNISAAEQKQTVVRNTADKIKDMVSGWSTKYGSSLSAIPGSEARTLKGLIDTMKANSAFSTLTELKASGGTLGAISEAELNLLERAWGALDQGGDNAEFLRVVDQLVDQNSGSLGRARNAYSMNKARFSGSYDDTQRQIQDENTVGWNDL